VAVRDPDLYVLPRHVEDAPGALWNAETLRGAILPLPELVAASDRHAIAMRFLRGRRAALRG
jgi:hypothetical protein